MTNYSKEELSKLIDSWKTDENDYRNGTGSKMLSQSDIGLLLRDPRQFRNPDDKPLLAYLHGSYYHEAILEPHKIKNYQIVDVANRNTKKYKEELEKSGKEILLLKNEKERLDKLVETTLSNKTARSLIRAEGNIYEQPGIVKLFGAWFKGRADILCNSQGIIIDLKTTTELDRFKYKAKKYHYHAQAYIYSKIFGMPFVFIAVDKNNGNLGIFECSDTFISEGEMAVENAVDIYNRYYKDKTPEETKELLANRILHQELY